MHLRSPHTESDITTLHTFIRSHPLGLITTAIDSPTHPLLQTSHVPWTLHVSSDTDLGTLRGHMARGNPQVQAMISELSSRAAAGHLDDSTGNGGELTREVLVLFNAPTLQHYVTPQWFTETKPVSGKVVPTWNYVAAQVYGKMRVWFDSKAGSTNQFLDGQLEGLTRHCERNVMGFEEPWEVRDAPEGYLRVMKKGIVGVEVGIERLEGKWKMSQEMGRGDREGVVRGFEEL
ncbi:hypothetical protein M011DRAFT_370404, partial [Sporormia fimetaria CBS 119925]